MTSVRADGFDPSRPFEVSATPLEGVLLIQPQVFPDERGFFLECFHAERYRDHGIPGPFVQDSHSRARPGVIRGLHYQHPHGQGKLIFVVRGEIYDVAVDIRVGSPTFGDWFGTRLDATSHGQIFIPPGYAHGYQALTEADVVYKCTELYHPESEGAIRWDDPDIGIEWPLPCAATSPRDAIAPWMKDQTRLPAHGAGS